jgi:hypothetical protein
MDDFTYEQVIQALRNADAAGDVEAARSLAEIANRMAQEQPQQQANGAMATVFGDRPPLEATGRQLGLAARAGLTGAAGIPSIVGDPLNQLLNMIAGREVFPPVSQSVQQLMTRAGLPQPETAQERVVQDVSSALSGVGTTAKLAQTLAPRAAAPLSENLGLQAAGALGGAGAASLGREEGAGALGQLGLGVLGGMVAPGAAGTTAQALTRATTGSVRPFTEAGRQVITGQVLRELSADPEAAMRAAQRYQPSIPGYRPTTAQATRDVGLISAETPIRSMETSGRFLAQTSEANQARMAILDRLAKDETALSQAIAKRNEVTTPLREQAFARSTVDPDTFQSAVTLTANKTIDDILASPAGARGTVAKAMQFAKDQLARGTDPQRLYEVRKDLRDAAQGLLDREGAAFSLAKKQLEQVIRSVDDVLEATAPGYKEYLSKYAASSRGIESLEAAQAVRSKVLSTTPDPSRVGDFLISQPAFTRAIRAIKDDPRTPLSRTQVAVLERVGRDLDEGVLQRGAKVPDSGTFKNLSTANIIGGIIGRQIVGEGNPALQKLAAPLNWLYNGTDDKIRELLVDAMLDPKLAADLMKKASIMRVEPLSKALQKKALNMGYGSIFGLE